VLHAAESRDARARRQAETIASDPYVHLRTPKLQLGDPAHDFELPRADLKRRTATGTVRLADLLGRRPIVLVFGSCTCVRFLKTYPRIESLAAKYGERVAFLVVYGREAHPPSSGHPATKSKRVRVAAEDPVDLGERVQVACECAESLPIALPLLVDRVDDHVTAVYGGRPNAARLVGSDGRLAYLSASNEAIDVPELERAIRREIGWRWWRPSR
jgi:hypothetical protein